MERNRLRLKHGNIELVGMALILMLLGSLVIVLSPRPGYYAPREQPPHAHSVSFNVSLDGSERNYPIEPLTYGIPTRIGITDMETNGTPVGLAIQNGSNVTVFAISSVSRIANSSLVVQASEDFKIIVSREIGNANGSLVILIWELPPPPPDFNRVIISFSSTIFILLVLSMIVVWKIVTMKTARQSIRPLWVVTLVVVGLVLLFPYITGSLGGFFTPTDVTEQVYSDRRTLVLNGTNPNSLVPFGNEVPNNAESFRIHSFEDGNRRYQFELLGANEEIILSAIHENSSIDWEIRGNLVSQDYSLSLNRADSDVTVSFSIRANVVVIKSPIDPLPSSILAILGLSSLVLAIVVGFSVQTKQDTGQN